MSRCPIRCPFCDPTLVRPSSEQLHWARFRHRTVSRWWNRAVARVLPSCDQLARLYGRGGTR
jgi:hypothetical protein